MARSYGHFTEERGGYRLTSLPEAGAFEYFYKNSRIFLKVDQFGPSFMQLDPLSGIRIINRAEREPFSPWKVMFQCGSDPVTNNFDVYSARSFEITYLPEKCVYDLLFDKVRVVTEISISASKPESFMTVRFENLSGNPLQMHAVLSCIFDPVDSSMAVWDKKEWYAKTSFSTVEAHPCFLLHHSSLKGLKDERRDFHMVCTPGYSAAATSLERLKYWTHNYSRLDSSVVGEPIDIYSYEGVSAAYYDFMLEGSHTLGSLIHAGKEGDATFADLVPDLDGERILEERATVRKAYEEMVSKRCIHTGDRDFDSFVNFFLPQELSWVMELDRGWNSGMRGSRDCSNDFMGFLPYDSAKCRSVIVRLLESQRYADGWFPRQIPFGSDKYDMREFVDSGCFVLELVYEYLAYTDDFALLDEKLRYLDCEEAETALQHIRKAVLYYTLAENHGEHGLIKLRCGDWLDSLSRLGLKGRAETLMVTAQSVLAFAQVKEILNHVGDHSLDSVFDEKTEEHRKAIRGCMNSDGYYDALFTDGGYWLLSSHDIDGHSRAYIPSNAYAMIAKADPSRDAGVIAKIKEMDRTDVGYRLITPPFGDPPFEGLGKLSSGDYFPYHLANGAVYNHGSQMFLLRALAAVGDHETFKDVLDFALPYNQEKHPESATCLPMYAITNSYVSVPAFYGRAGHAFLTGTIAMIERTIYNWMLGIDFTCSSIRIHPCLPREFADATATVRYNGHRLDFRYHGYGSEVASCTLNGVEVSEIDKKSVLGDCTVDVFLTLS